MQIWEGFLLIHVILRSIRYDCVMRRIITIQA